jgi:hypothetical protein
MRKHTLLKLDCLQWLNENIALDFPMPKEKIRSRTSFRLLISTIFVEISHRDPTSQIKNA